MLLVDMIAGAMVTTGASLMLIGVIGLVLTRAEEQKQKEDGNDR
jgi:predicted phage tail protein